MFKYCIIFYKALEHPQVLLPMGVLGTNPPGILRDDFIIS
jgi:hypothetical protein